MFIITVTQIYLTIVRQDIHKKYRTLKYTKNLYHEKCNMYLLLRIRFLGIISSMSVITNYYNYAPIKKTFKNIFLATF